MAKRKDCFGEFTSDKEKCDKCSTNIDCFIQMMKTDKCFSEAMANDDFVCSVHACVNDSLRCGNIRFILAGTIEIECFGTLNQQSDKCLVCKHNDQFRCELAQVIRTDLSLTREEIISSLTEQIQEMEEDHANCFGNFEFATECPKCEYLMSCRKKSNVLPGKACIHWHKESEENLEETRPCDKECTSAESCTNILILIQDKLKVALESKKIFIKSHSLAELRGMVMTEEENENGTENDEEENDEE